jgi:hypothetical protein
MPGSSRLRLWSQREENVTSSALPESRYDCLVPFMIAFTRSCMWACAAIELTYQQDSGAMAT